MLIVRRSMNIILYAPEDQHHLERLLLHLQDAQGVKISGTLDTALTDQPIHSVILLMSIDLLHRLVCETAYLALYRRLRLLEREGMTVIAYVRACNFPSHFKRSRVFPPAGPTITERTRAAQEAIYQEIAAALKAGEA